MADKEKDGGKGEKPARQPKVDRSPEAQARAEKAEAAKAKAAAKKGAGAEKAPREPEEKVTPRLRTHFDEVIRKTMTKAAGLGGTELTLKAMRSNEEVLNKTYAHHVALDFPDDIKEVIRGNYGDEQRHLAWIEQALQSRLWETGVGAHP